ncbi:guanine nucleotide exchange factor for Rab-3A-like [Clytia hemisphaerica]|uniref:GDP/GTP exchange factor Sec2 N-terminal domain-containing protein n=1 Tax=Clytia hemisphaerica TaxID=252671 RepID=A0A7M5WW86_9CNID
MLSSESASLNDNNNGGGTSLQRTASEPDMTNADNIIRSKSNASQCSKVKKKLSTHIHHTGEDLLPVTRSRTVSGFSIGNGDIGRVRSISGYGSALGATPIEGVSLEELSEESLDFSRQAFDKLRKDLERAQQELRTRDSQCQELSKVRDTVDQEIEELTASLFEEANKMVIEANVARMSWEKKFHEAELQLDGLQAECHALKALVITSTPSNPGKQRFHKRAPSVGQICNGCDTFHYITDLDEQDWSSVDPINKKEVDPLVFQSFCSWMEDNCPLKDHQFLSIVHRDDVVPCLRFPNEDLSKAIYKAAQSDTLAIEPIKSKPKKCALTSINGPCPYRVRTGDSDNWYPISGSCRARIVTVIDFLTFLRYIRQGIIKKDVNVLYWEMVKKRADINLARLGLENPK